MPSSKARPVHALRICIPAALLALALWPAHHARAEANDYIRLPTVEYGEREIDFKTGVQRNRDGRTEAAHSVGYGFTPASWWFTEVYGKYARPAGESQHFDAWEWENRFQLTDTGKYPVDLGWLVEIERPRERAEGYELTLGPMLQTESGPMQFNANLFLRRHLRATEHFDRELLYQLQVKYRHSQALEWGLQGFGRVSPWDHGLTASPQEFKLGPALFGKIKAGPGRAIRWNAALLAGTTHATPHTTLRVQAEYEF